MKRLFFMSPILFISLASCVSGHVNFKRIDQEAFPPGFNDQASVLILQKRTSGINARGMNKYLNKYFKKHYSGKFEMAAIEDILNNPKYQDRQIYRYVLTDEVWSDNTTVRTTTTTMGGAPSSNTGFQYNNAYRIGYHLYDLLENKSYPDMGISSNVPASAMKKAAIVLDYQLKK